MTDEEARNKEELEDVLGPEVNDNDFGLESKFQSRLFKILFFLVLPFKLNFDFDHYLLKMVHNFAKNTNKGSSIFDQFYLIVENILFISQKC